VADHPLRPATDRRLGGPLPRQLANQTQDPLLAPGLSVPRFHHSHPSKRSHAVLPLLSERYSPLKGRFPTRYSPVCHAPCGTSDLHVLGTPPAFILSQDQTLKFHSELSSQTTRVDLEKMLWSKNCSEFCKTSLDASQNPQRLPIFYPVFKDAPMLLSTVRSCLPASPAPRSLNCAGHPD
jgi:hypothetical protein